MQRFALACLWLSVALFTHAIEPRAPEPQHVLSLCSPATATVLALGASNQLAAVDEHGARLPGAEKVRVLAHGGAVSAEEAVALGVDLAFVWSYQEKTAAALERLHIPVVRMPTGRAADIPADIRRVGIALGRAQQAESLARPVEGFLRELPVSVTNRPRVFLELYSPGRTAGADTFVNDLIVAAGGENVAAGHAGFATWSAEQLVAADPEFIVFIAGYGNAAEIARRPGWALTRAACTQRVIALDRRWLVAGPEFPQAVAALRVLLQAQPKPGATHALP
jgi:iron complex transport system substrate-binding protein